MTEQPPPVEDEHGIVPDLDDNGIPVDAEIRQATDEEWLAAMASIPAEPGADADLINPDADNPGGPDDDTFDDAEVDHHLDPGQDDPALDVDIDDEDADLLDTDTDQPVDGDDG